MCKVENAFCEEIQTCPLCFFNCMFIWLNAFVGAQTTHKPGHYYER